MPFLRHLDLQLTHRCNLRCAYCYAAGGAARLPSDLSPDLADAAVDFLFAHAGESPRVRIECWGGEPFLRPDLIARVAERARERALATGKTVSVHVPTNVTLLDAAARDLVRRVDLQISLSLDGGPEGNVYRRTPDGESAWPLIAPCLDALVAESDGRLPPVRMTVFPARAHRLADDVAYLHARGFRQLSFLPASGVDWSPEATAALDAQLALIADRFVARIRSGHPSPPYYPRILRQLGVRWRQSRSGSVPRRAGNCGAGGYLVAVDTRGDLYPCHRVVARIPPPASLKLGCLETGITETALRDRLCALSLDQPDVRCATCPSRDDCSGLCPALNERVTGDLANVPDAACHVQQRIARVASRIHEALVEEPAYRAYIEPFLDADPDERLEPLLAALDTRQDEILDAILDDLVDLDDQNDDATRRGASEKGGHDA